MEKAAVGGETFFGVLCKVERERIYEGLEGGESERESEMRSFFSFFYVIFFFVGSFIT